MLRVGNDERMETHTQKKEKAAKGPRAICHTGQEKGAPRYRRGITGVALYNASPLFSFFIYGPLVTASLCSRHGRTRCSITKPNATQQDRKG